jgi:hypothetical protein
MRCGSPRSSHVREAPVLVPGGDAAAIEALVDGLVNDLVAELGG